MTEPGQPWRRAAPSHKASTAAPGCESGLEHLSREPTREPARRGGSLIRGWQTRSMMVMTIQAKDAQQTRDS
jgi:hypothetical protein